MRIGRLAPSATVPHTLHVRAFHHGESDAAARWVSHINPHAAAQAWPADTHVPHKILNIRERIGHIPRGALS